MKEITSTKNEHIKELKKLHQKKSREKVGKYLLEGFHLVEEAILAGAEIELILLDERGMNEWGRWLNQQQLVIWSVSEEVMSALSELPGPQGIIAVVKKAAKSELTYHGKWLLLDNVQDPGNVGTMIRTADAAGFDGVLLGAGTADIYTTKVLRSMQGSQYHLMVETADLSLAIEKFKENHVPVYGSELNEQAIPYNEPKKSAEVALLVGNEGAGVERGLLQKTNANLYIPIFGQAESLNVAIAAAILMYEFARNNAVFDKK